MCRVAAMSPRRPASGARNGHQVQNMWGLHRPQRWVVPCTKQNMDEDVVGRIRGLDGCWGAALESSARSPKGGHALRLSRDSSLCRVMEVGVLLARGTARLNTQLLAATTSMDRPYPETLRVRQTSRREPPSGPEDPHLCAEAHLVLSGASYTDDADRSP